MSVLLRRPRGPEVKPHIAIAPLWSLYPSSLERKIHSSIYLLGDREQLEHLACRHPGALDSVLNRSCPAHHHRTTAYQDTEVTCNMSPDSRRGGRVVIIYSLTFLPPLLSCCFLIFPSPIFCQQMMHNIHALCQRVAVGCSIWGEHSTDRDMSASFPGFSDRLILGGL